jgi:hypothetical protein
MTKSPDTLELRRQEKRGSWIVECEEGLDLLAEYAVADSISHPRFSKAVSANPFYFSGTTDLKN